jgi:hypothetical protein
MREHFLMTAAERFPKIPAGTRGTSEKQVVCCDCIHHAGFFDPNILTGRFPMACVQTAGDVN